MNSRLKIFIAVTVLVIAIMFLIGSGMNDTMVYYVTAKELKADPAKFAGRGLRLNGKVVANSLVKSSATAFEFAIMADGELVRVRYAGILPDTFKENHEVLLEGEYIGDDVFVARQIFTKCASKYEAVPEHDSTMMQK